MPTFNKDNKVKSNFERISISLASPEDIKGPEAGDGQLQDLQAGA